MNKNSRKSFSRKRQIKDAAKRLAWYLRPESQQFSIGIVSFGQDFADPNISPAIKLALSRRDITDVSAEFIADPFMTNANGTWYMFFEVFVRENWTGEIGVASSRDGFSWKYHGIVLRESFHLSYPHILEWRGAYFMIPETWQADEIRLYKANTFPFGWELDRVLVSGEKYLDSTIFSFSNRWWMFTSVPKVNGGYKLLLYFAISPEGPWTSHPLNPLYDDNLDKARCAGKVIMHKNSLYRFAQSSLPVYGSEVRAFKIVQLDETSFSEVEIDKRPFLSSGCPGWAEGGMHHIDLHCDSETRWLGCVDGWRYSKFQLRNLIHTLRYPISRRAPGDFFGTA